MMGLSCIFEGYGKFCSGKNITKRSLFEVKNPCLSSFLGKFLHSLKRANPTTTAVNTIQSKSFALIRPERPPYAMQISWAYKQV